MAEVWWKSSSGGMEEFRSDYWLPKNFVMLTYGIISEKYSPKDLANLVKAFYIWYLTRKTDLYFRLQTAVPDFTVYYPTTPMDQLLHLRWGVIKMNKSETQRMTTLTVPKRHQRGNGHHFETDGWQAEKQERNVSTETADEALTSRRIL